MVEHNTASQQRTTIEQLVRGFDQCRQCQELTFTLNLDTELRPCQLCHYKYCSSHHKINDNAARLSSGHRCDYLVRLQCGHCQENIQATSAREEVFCKCRALKIQCTRDVKEGVCQTVDTVYWTQIKPNPAHTSGWYDDPLYAHPVTERERFAGGISIPG
jgi:hypothetical protein